MTAGLLVVLTCSSDASANASARGIHSFVSWPAPTVRPGKPDGFFNLDVDLTVEADPSAHERFFAHQYEQHVREDGLVPVERARSSNAPPGHPTR